MNFYLKPQRTVFHRLKSIWKGLDKGGLYLRKVSIIQKPSQSVNYKTNVALVPLLLALLLPGCAIVNPNVTLERQGPEKLKPQGSKAEEPRDSNGAEPVDPKSKIHPEETKQYTLSQGIQYAEGQ